MKRIVFAMVGLWMVVSVAMASPSTLDLSTPQNAFLTLVNALKAGDRTLLQNIASPSGIESFVAQDLQALGAELEKGEVSWNEITKEIYLAQVEKDEKVHKFEFVLEEKGWMLYFWTSVSAPE